MTVRSSPNSLLNLSNPVSKYGRIWLIFGLCIEIEQIKVNRLKHYKFETSEVRLSGVEAMLRFLEPILFNRSQEMMIAAFCDTQLHLVQLRLFPGGDHSVEMSLRDLFRDATDHSGLLVAHNHPGGDPRPSTADLKLTRRVAVVCDALDITLLDHLIMAPDRTFSFRRSGLM